MPSKLDQLAAMTTIVADTGDIEAVRRLKPVDCTTNPTLILKAAGMEAYAALVDEAVRWGLSRAGSREARTEAICDRLAVTFGAELARLVPGRVSTEVDADLSFDIEGSVAKGRALIADYAARGVERARILIKLAATWEGIQAARVLQKEGIDCNLTLLFSMVQARACADAKVFLVSPFVGRILDWHVKAGGGPYTAETDPGVISVKAIYDHYKEHGIDTVVMGASFRNRGEIEALAGCDRLTISPALLDELARTEGDLPRVLAPPALPVIKQREALSEKDFRHELNEDAMAVEKLSEGIRGFVKDMRELRRLVAARLVD